MVNEYESISSATLLCGVVVLGCIFWSIFGRKRTASHPLLKRVPGGYPLIGNLLDFLPHKMVATAARYPKLYGPFVEYYLLSTRSILVTDLNICREVLFKRPKKFRRIRSLDYGAVVFDVISGLFQSEGSTWQRIRKATAPSFNLSHITAQYPSMVNELVDWMERLAIAQKADGQIDMKFQAFSFTIRITTLIALGLNPKDPISSYFFTKQFKDDMEIIFKFLVESALFFFPRWLWKYTPLYKYEMQCRDADSRFTKACSNIIAYKRDQITSDSKNGGKDSKFKARSMIDSMLLKESNTTNDSTATDADQESHPQNELSDQDIIANVKTFYLAGTDTTSVILSWLAYYFSCNPEVLRRSREEVQQVLFANLEQSDNVKHTSDSQKENIDAFLSKLSDLKPKISVALTENNISLHLLSSLPYCLAVVKEILRLSGPASTNGCQTTNPKESVVLTNGVVVGPNDIIWCNIDGLHLREDIWGEDVKTFNPARWLPETSSPGKIYTI
jgi:cytochrome P450